jgi:hypothetical protein
VARVQIQIGSTESHRFLGIQPPLTDAQSELLHAAIEDERAFLPSPTWFVTMRPESSEAYSRVGIRVNELASEQMGDDRMIILAQKVARVLERSGDTVTIDETEYPLGPDPHLFAG